MWHSEFRHPRLVEIYDAQFCGWEAEPVGSTDGELLVLAHRPAATGH